MDKSINCKIAKLNATLACLLQIVFYRNNLFRPYMFQTHKSKNGKDWLLGWLDKFALV